jgi:hypothetical protein
VPPEPRDRIRANYTKVPNSIFDGELLVPLNGTARYIYIDLVRLTLGHNRETCKISREGLAKRTGFSENGCVKALRELAAAGLVAVESNDNTSPNRHDRGTTYRVYLPAEAVSPDAPLQNAGARRGGAQSAGPQTAPPRSAGMKEIPKETHESPSVYEIRTIAARLFEAHRGDLSFDHDRLRELVRDALIGAGKQPDGGAIEEAIRGMAG